MDWLSKHHGAIDCARKSVLLTSPDGVIVEFTSELPASQVGALNQLTTPSLEQVPVVREYPDVFPDELPGMPPDRYIEFVIELVPGTAPIAKRP